MLLRAAVVLLVILNFGVAVWWAVRDAPGDAAALIDTGPVTLRLVGEPALDVPAAPPPMPTTEHAGDAAVDVAPRAADPARCVALGPFADAAARDAALAQLAPAVVRIAARDVGFNAGAAPLGATQVGHWVDAMLAEGDTGDALRTRAGVARVEARDCNARWDAG